jgi:hypothetical protein
MDNDNDKAPRGTRVRTPDLDWSQVRETVLMLELAAGQIEAAMKDSNTSVAVLTDSFTSIADTVSTLPDNGESGAAKATLHGITDHVSGMVNQSIVAFQFYDKLAQRLDHICLSLASLSDLVGDQARLFNPAQWATLQEKIRSKYSMREEVEMFEAVMAGMPVKEALARFMTEMKDKGDDIELF